MKEQEIPSVSAEEYLRGISSLERFEFYYREAHQLRDVLRLYCRDKFVGENSATIEEIRVIVGLACQYLAIHQERVGEILRRQKEAEKARSQRWIVNQDAVEMYADNPWLFTFAAHLSQEQIAKMVEVYWAEKRKEEVNGETE